MRLLTAALVAALATVPTMVAAQAQAQAQAQAPAKAASCVQVAHGWVRLPPAPVPMLAGFGHIHSQCPTAQAVVSARSPYFGEVTVHETTVVDGVSRMREIEQLPLPAGAHVELAPGGLHLMLMRPESQVSEGQEIPLVLVLGDGSELHTTLVVRKAAPVDAAHQPGAHHGHHH